MSVQNQPKYALVGMFAGSPAFTIAATNPLTFGEFVTITNPNSATPIDSLVITMTNPVVTCCANEMGFDNVELIR